MPASSHLLRAVQENKYWRITILSTTVLQVLFSMTGFWSDTVFS